MVVFALLTVALATVAGRGLRIDASFTKQLPLKHEYMQTFVKHQAEFGGANRVLIALVARDGDMFTPGFFDALKKATDEVLVMDGIDRGRVQSLFTPNVRYIEVVEGGFSGGNVVPADYAPTQEMLDQVRSNVGKSGLIGRMVSNDQHGAMIFSELLDRTRAAAAAGQVSLELQPLLAAQRAEDVRPVEVGVGAGRRVVHATTPISSSARRSARRAKCVRDLTVPSGMPSLRDASATVWPR